MPLSAARARAPLALALRPWLCVIAGLLLVADAAFLIALNVFNVGVALPLALGCALLALGLRWEAVQRWRVRSPGRRKAWRWAWAGALAWVLSVALFWSVLARAGHDAGPGQPPAAILVLGSGTPNGRPSPVLAARLDLALQQAARYPGAVVAVSGGVDFGETLSEGRIMGDYLRARGLSPYRIVQEEKSTSTQENLLFSEPLLRQYGVSVRDPVLVVTSDFHTLRARWIAQRAGYSQVFMTGSATPLYVRYNAWLREYFAVLVGFLLREFG